MTYQHDYTFSENLVEKGLEAEPEMMRVLINQNWQIRKHYCADGVSSTCW